MSCRTRAFNESFEQRDKRPTWPRSTRRQGAQPSYPRHQRPLAPEADIDAVRNYFPNALCRCRATVAIDPEPACRHQVVDFLPVKAHLTEPRLFGGGFERNPKRGLRIDHPFTTAPMTAVLVDAGIDEGIRAMEKPSDHCPVRASLISESERRDERRARRR